MSKIAYVLAGVAIGLLVAPRKGTATRAKINQGLREFTNGADKFAEKATDAVNVVASSMKSAAFRKADELEQKLYENT